MCTVTGDARPDLEGKTGRAISEVSTDGACCATKTAETDSDAKQAAGACC